ncbi:MAG: NAD-glutamate dehydrogenase [Deltaproteobacteria bacterium]|nr:NAD-glutamate dehydrogenase [Deltaproteobacteria bacterium]
MQTEVVRKVLSLAQQAVKETHRDRLDAYIHAYCRAIPPEVLAEVDPNRLLAFTMDRFAFLEEDFARTVKVVIRDPESTLLGEETPCTVIETRLPDCAFVVRTIKAFLRQQGLQIQFVLHPIHGVIHESGQITGIDRDRGRGTRISQVYMQVSPIAADRRDALRADLESRLGALLIVNGEHGLVRERFEHVRGFLTALSTGNGVRASEATEALELSDWLADDNFVFGGYAFYPYEGSGRVKAPERRHGLFATTDHALEEVIGEIVATRRNREELYSFYRTDYTTVVRSVAQVRYFGVAQPGTDGRPTGEHVFVGLISTRGLKQPNRRVPVVAKRIQEVMASLEDQPGSYTYGKVHAILDSIPLEDLFYWTTDEIREIADQFRLVESKDQARVFVWRRKGGRRVSVVCVVPRMRFSEAMRERLSQEIGRALGAPKLREYRAETDDESPIRMHFTVGRYRPGVADGDLDGLKEKLEVLLESWDDQLRRLVFKRYRGRADASSQSRYLATVASAQEIWSRYGGRFSESYKGQVSPEMALADIALMERIDDGNGISVSLVLLGEDADRHTSLRLFSRSELLLNDVVPVLQQMALRATSRLAERIATGSGTVHITCFEINGVDGRAIDDETTLERLGTIVRLVLSGHLANDRLLGLGYLAGLDWKQIDLLITYRNYFTQVFPGYASQTVDETLLKHPQAAALASEYFHVKFSTEREEPATERLASLLPPISARYDELLQKVTVIQEDAILRRFFDLFEATRRTNYFRGARGDVISIKLESNAIEHMPRPCPLFEIYVHGPGVEGIHLRGGKVARGGIRHSDRVDDFRTEVLGLQRTQTLKNTVIVPVGSKGGFITKKHFTDRAQMGAEAKRQYEAFIAGLLDVTDNYQASGIVPPPGVVRYDQDDPYLVVAADKGTAHLSDTANGISARYEFWLDDAFASGGSAGYDHKAMGITSRGGWTNVERHFREMGTDIRQTSIRVAGVGDMSGDVFGNGMLLNDKLKLVAAFNHKHIFLDPTPEPASSYAERQRLFKLPGSQWSDYDASAISRGGGVFERAAKEIVLSPEAKALLGMTANVVSGPDLVRAILMLDVDLVWFGGIGTYVKASVESNAEVGDKVNDNVRVNANELRAKVIGEGANLAVTQRARTEYLLLGGRSNTDAIDNSAGVDCSDHEVNLKILFAPLMASGALERRARDAFLREIEPDVGLACVKDNYLQSALLSMEQLRTKKSGERFLDVLAYLDRNGLSRAAEHIPSDEELRGWLATGRGLTRNLLAVLVAHTKNDLFPRVLASTIPDLPFVEPYLFDYFPKKVTETYRGQIQNHHLRREIVATVVTNAVVNQAGCTLLVDLARETALPVDQLVVRYLICDELVGGRALREAIHGWDLVVPSAEQYAALIAIEDTLVALLRWWLWNESAWRLMSDGVKALQREFDEATDALLDGLEGAHRTAYDARVAELAQKGFAPTLAGRIARTGLMRDAFAVLAAARDGSVPVTNAAANYLRAGQSLELDTFHEVLATQLPANTWERRFLVSLEREAASVRQAATRKLATDASLPERNFERVVRIGDALRMVRQLGAGGLVPLFLILEDYRALLNDEPIPATGSRTGIPAGRVSMMPPPGE